jgi:hypothetical protein
MPWKAPLGKEKTDPWLVYRDNVPEDVRNRIKEDILAASIDGFDSFLEVTVGITASILSGEIHHEVAKEARSFLELALTAVTAKALQQGGPKDTGGVSARLAAVRAKRGRLPAPQPEFTIDIQPEQAPVKVPTAPWDSSND